MLCLNNVRLFSKLLLRAIFALVTCLTTVHAQTAAQQQSTDILLAQVYQDGVDVKRYLVSEKYDGVRAIWDGQQLKTRSGHIIAAPAWFTQALPAIALDGELWTARGEFDALSGAVRKTIAVEQEWQNISYLVFELPNAQGSFAERAQKIEHIVKQANVLHLKAVKQFYVQDAVALKQHLKRVVAQGGEGLMLHLADARYVTGRSDVLLKLKPQLDAEATVVAHSAGRGKYLGKLGALVVQTPEGVQFKLGTGLTDAQRLHPPPIGAVVTYTYRGLTKSGKPKFASFLRVRQAL